MAQEEPLCLAVICQVTNPGSEGSTRIPKVEKLSSKANLSGCAGHKAAQSPEELAGTGADLSSEAYDCPLRRFEGSRTQSPAERSVRELDTCRILEHTPRLRELLPTSPEHKVD